MTAEPLAGAEDQTTAPEVEEESQPGQPVTCSEHAAQDAVITSRLNEREAFQYRHLMLKTLLNQKRGVRCGLIMMLHKSVRTAIHLLAVLRAQCGQTLIENLANFVFPRCSLIHML